MGARIVAGAAGRGGGTGTAVGEGTWGRAGVGTAGTGVVGAGRGAGSTKRKSGVEGLSPCGDSGCPGRGGEGGNGRCAKGSTGVRDGFWTGSSMVGDGLIGNCLYSITARRNQKTALWAVFWLRALFLRSVFDGQVDASLVINVLDHDTDLLSDLKYVAWSVDAFFGDLGDMDHAVLAWEDFDEGAEIK